MSVDKDNRRELLVAWIFVGLMMLVCWARLPWSGGLWLDETLSAWTVSGSLTDAWNRAILFQTQSPLFYLFVWGVRKVSGTSEIALRAVSIAAACGTLIVVAIVAARLGQRRVAVLYTCGFLLGCDVFLVGSITARPYALATLFALLSIHATLVVRERYSHGSAFLCSVATILTWYSHYLFVIVALGNLFTLVRVPGRLRKMSLWIIAVIVVCLPGAAHFLKLRERSSGLLFTGLPTPQSMVSDSVPLPLIVAALLGALIAYIWDARLRLDERARAALRLALPYIVLPPIIFALLALVGGGAVWLPRYWEWQVAMCVVVVSVLIERIDGARFRALAFMTTALFVLGRATLQMWHTEGWDRVGAIARTYNGPVVLFSGLIEAETMVSRGEPGFEEYVRSPLLAYGRGSEVQLARLSASDSELQTLFTGPVLLVAARKRVGIQVSPDKFLTIATSKGYRVTPLLEGEPMIQAYDIR